MGYCTETFTTQVDGNERLTCSCGEFVQREPSMADGSWQAVRRLFERRHATFAPTLRFRWLFKGRARLNEPQLQQLWTNTCQEQQWRAIPVEYES